MFIEGFLFNTMGLVWRVCIAGGGLQDIALSLFPAEGLTKLNGYLIISKVGLCVAQGLAVRSHC